MPTTWLWTAMLLAGVAVTAAALAVTSLILVVRVLLGVRRPEPDPVAVGRLWSSSNGHGKDHQVQRPPEGERHW
jgi:hypothetical protein